MEIGKNWVEPEVRIRADEEEIGAQIAERLKDYQENQLVVKMKEGFVLLNKSEIIYLEVFNKVMTLYTADENYSYRKSLAALKKSFQRAILQVSKSAIVNTKEIKN